MVLKPLPLAAALGGRGGRGKETSGGGYGQALSHGLLHLQDSFPTLPDLTCGSSGFPSGCLRAAGNIPQEYRGGISHRTNSDQQERGDWKESANKFLSFLSPGRSKTN